MRVFFYGLFMDENLLAAKGLEPEHAAVGFLDGYGLRIGERATLVGSSRERAYGTTMDVADHEVAKLYAEDSVSDYLPEPVTVELQDGTCVKATCFNLPDYKLGETNRDYADSLLEVATRLGFPDSYLEQIRRAKRSG